MSTIPPAHNLVDSPVLATRERPVVIIIQDDPGFALDICRALRVSGAVRACLLTDLSNGLQRVDVWPQVAL